MLRRSLPGRERWLFVHWIDDADPAIINQEWILNMRDRLTTRFYKADSVNRDPHYLKSYEKEIANRLAVVVEGLWENTTEVVGGPFRTYAFYDEKSGRIYMIDISVYSPAGTKEPFLRQLAVMANTFQTA